MAQIKHGTLVATIVTTVEIDAGTRAIEVFNRGSTGDIWVREGTDPTVAGDDCDVATPGTAVRVESPTRGKASVRLLSAATPAYTVRGLTSAAGMSRST